MDSLVSEVPIETVMDLKRRTQIPRSTFYRYYASLEDLENNFLGNYYELLIGAKLRSLRSYDDLRCHYMKLWKAMKCKENFFVAVLKSTKFPGLRLRWLDVVMQNYRFLFPRNSTANDAHLWDVHTKFARGIMEQFVIHIVDSDEDDMLQLIKLMYEYSWGGLHRLRDSSSSAVTPIEHILTVEFQKQTLRGLRHPHEVQLV